MKKGIKFSLLFLLVTGFVACNGKGGSDNTAGENADTLTTRNEMGANAVGNIFIVPDSIWNDEAVRNDTTWTIRRLWTPEQEKLARLVMNTYMSNAEVVDGRLKFMLSREQFTDLGIPDLYYDFILQQIDAMNTLEENGFPMNGKTIADIWEEGKELIRQDFLEKQ